MDIQLHPVTQRQLEAIQLNLPQSLILTGKSGVGLKTIAQFIAGNELSATIEPRNTKGDSDPKTGTIGIDAIRELYYQTRTKHSQRRILIIDDADYMSRGAQAAFLKLLEEPNASTHFILTSHRPSLLLATVRSRLQRVAIQPLTSVQTQTFIETLKVADEKKKTQLQFIAPGQPAEILRLLANSAYFETRAKIILDARTFLQADAYQKLRTIHTYRSDREGAISLIEGAMTILNHTLLAKPQQGLIQQLAQLLEAKERILANQSITLNLTRIVL